MTPIPISVNAVGKPSMIVTTTRVSISTRFNPKFVSRKTGRQTLNSG